MEKKDRLNFIVNWLNQKWKGEKKCPICRDNNWDISDKIFQILEYHGGGTILGGITYPSIPITCGNCGYTLFFNPIILGLIGGKNEKSDLSDIESDMIDVL